MRDAVVVADGSGRAASVHVVGSRATRVLSGTSFRDALGLGSGWFTLAVLSLDEPRGPAKPGTAVVLNGFARGESVVRLQKSLGAAWAPVRRLDLDSEGRFRTTVRPASTTRYRLVAGKTVGPVIVVSVRRYDSLQQRWAGQSDPSSATIRSPKR